MPGTARSTCCATKRAGWRWRASWCRSHRASAASEGHFDRELSDDELALLFAVCHPLLSPEMRVTFALKTVCGLTVPQIAAGLLSEPTTIAQRLVRARRQLEPAGVAIEPPPPEALPGAPNRCAPRSI